MRNLWKNLAASVVCSLSLVTSIFGQSVGDEVVVVEKTDLKHDTTVVEAVPRGNYLKVRDVNGNWLWVDFDGSRGWINRDHVILASRAIDHFTDAIRRNPKDETALIARSVAWQIRGELTNAIRDCTDAIAINSERSWAYLIRGNAWNAKKEYDLAIVDYEEGIRLNPKLDAMFLNRGLCYHDKKNYDKAIADFTEAIRLNPKSAHNYFCRANVYADQEQYDKAIADDTEAIRLDSRNIDALNNRGIVWSYLEKFDSAIADHTAAIQIDGKHPLAYSGRGWAWQCQKEFAKALADYNIALKLDPTDEYAMEHAFLLSGDYGKALELLEKQIGRDSKNSDACNSLAWLHATCPVPKFRDGVAAIELAKKSGDLAGWKAPEFDTLAAAYAEHGQFDDAIKAQEKAVSLVTTNKKPEYAARLELYRSGMPFREDTKAALVTTTAAK